METKTHWKKNNDSRYISGEDLMSGLRGLKPEMNVILISHQDSETFDQKSQNTIIKTGLWMQEIGGQNVYKPVILNNTNAKFLIKEFGSEFIEDWFGKPVVLYAQKDKRHGYVARFKKYYPNQAAAPQQPQVSQEDINTVLQQIELQTDLDGLGKYYLGLDSILKSSPQIIAAKDAAKIKLA